MVRGCELRFRPIIVSAILAVIGFPPAALSHGIGAEIQRPLARVVIGGLISSTPLTLLVLPAVYELLSQGWERSQVRSSEIYGGYLTKSYPTMSADVLKAHLSLVERRRIMIRKISTGETFWRYSLGRPMKRRSSLAWLSILPFLYSCASLRLSGEMQTGRQALLMNKPEVALPYFQHVAETDPNYLMRFGGFQEGVWTYLGRAQYLRGQLPEARQSLEKALSRDKDDYLARLYLGLTLARSGDRSGGLKEIESGMKGIYDQLQMIVAYGTPGLFWDPRGEIRAEIQSNLGMIAGKEIDWQKLISSGEWVGQKMEEEVDLARRDEINDHDADPGV